MQAAVPLHQVDAEDIGGGWQALASLRRLTSLQLHYPEDLAVEQLHGCTGLRDLGVIGGSPNSEGN